MGDQIGNFLIFMALPLNSNIYSQVPFSYKVYYIVDM